MKQPDHRAWTALALLATAIAFTPAPAHAVFVVTEPWMRPAAARAPAEAYMELYSDEGTTLVAVRAAIAARVVLVDAQGRPLGNGTLPLPPRSRVMLAPGKTRIALADVARPLRLGDRVPLTLVLRNADGTTQEIAVDAEVRRRSPTDDHKLPHPH